MAKKQIRRDERNLGEQKDQCTGKSERHSRIEGNDFRRKSSEADSRQSLHAASNGERKEVSTVA